MTERQRQEAGDESSLVQAGHDVNIFGLTYEQAERLAKLVYESRAPELAEAAADLVINRVQQFNQRLLDHVAAANVGFEALGDPDLQRRLQNAQVTFASSGDDDLGNLLVELLAERFEEQQRNRRQVILSQALDSVDKLTAVQADALSVIFLFWYVSPPAFEDIDEVTSWASTILAPVAQNLPYDNDIDFRHLHFAGCADRVFHHSDWTGRMRQMFPAALSEHSSSDVEARVQSVQGLSAFSKAWSDAGLNRLRLTPVGLAIGHGNLRRKTTLDAPLSLWIPA